MTTRISLEGDDVMPGYRASLLDEHGCHSRHCFTYMEADSPFLPSPYIRPSKDRPILETSLQQCSLPPAKKYLSVHVSDSFEDHGHENLTNFLAVEFNHSAMRRQRVPGAQPFPISTS